MAWFRTSAKPLPEPTMSESFDAFMRHQTLMCDVISRHRAWTSLAEEVAIWLILFEYFLLFVVWFRLCTGTEKWFLVVKDKLSSSSTARIRTRASQEPSLQQTESSLTNRLGYQASSKNLNCQWTDHRNDQRTFNPRDATVLDHICLLRYTYLLSN